MSLVDETLRVEWAEETNTRSCNKNKDNISLVVMYGSRKICQRESSSVKVVWSVCFLLLFYGREDPYTTKGGPLSERQRNAI